LAAWRWLFTASIAQSEVYASSLKWLTLPPVAATMAVAVSRPIPGKDTLPRTVALDMLSDAWLQKNSRKIRGSFGCRRGVQAKGN
jgi:hypothetical protein